MSGKRCEARSGAEKRQIGGGRNIYNPLVFFFSFGMGLPPINLRKLVNELIWSMYDVRNNVRDAKTSQDQVLATRITLRLGDRPLDIDPP